MDQRTGQLIDILTAAGPDGLTPADLLSRLRERWPNLTRTQAERLVTAAAGHVTVDGGRVRLTTPAPTASAAGTTATTSGPASDGRPWRAVAFDLEPATRLVSHSPYVEARIYQVGAVRFGRDTDWVAAGPTFEAWVELPDGFTLYDPARRGRHAAGARPAAEVIAGFNAYSAEADVLVAHNGSGLDFPLLDATAASVGLPAPAGARRADSLLVGLTVWPFCSHRLHDLAATAGVPVAGRAWHDAVDDAAVCAAICDAAAGVVAGWDPDRIALYGAVGAASPVWGLLFDLAVLPATAGRVADDVVAATVAATLAARPPRRGLPPTGPVTLPAAVTGSGGHVDPLLLATAVHGEAEPRPAQEEMAAILTRFVADGTDGMVEAPTGVGKTFAVLAAAFDWLAVDPDAKVIVATHTKQLQAQLADDLEALATAGLGILTAGAGLVKGAGNRLSLRALVGVLADATGGRGDHRLGELALYLLSRLAATPGRLVEEWEAYSVDPVDIPAFFDTYLGWRRSRWLVSMSQGEAGDYRPGPGTLAALAETAAEALARHRLVVANHALLLAHRDEFVDDGTTLLVVDEAHAVEGAATDALTGEVDYQALEALAAAAARYASGDAAAAGIGQAGADLERILDSGRLPNAAMRAFDRLAGPPDRDSNPRRAALVSAYTGSAGRNHIQQVVAELRRIDGSVGRLRQALGRYAADVDVNSLERWRAERYYTLAARAKSLGEAAAAVVSDVDAVWGPPPWLAGGGSAAGGTGAPAPGLAGPAAAAPSTGGAPDGGSPDDASWNVAAADVTITLDDPTELPGAAGDGEAEADEVTDADAALAAEDAATDNAAADEVGDVGHDVPVSGPPALAPPHNRVVWAAEQPGSRLAEGERAYRFTIATSPVELPAEAAWAGLRSRFARSLWVSATLTVAGRFDYVRSRLGFGADMAEARVGSPFDHATQSRLVCLGDFPSWAEQPVQAIRSVAWQTAGFLAATTRREAPGPDGYAAVAGGAMLLTTSTSAAAQIAERLAADLPGRWDRPDPPPELHPAPLHGNARAVTAYRARGGALVGTKGLWAGVNISEPDRARLLWINKLPFAPFNDPLTATRRAAVAGRAEAAGAEDPDTVATEDYYLPLAALELRQAVGRLIRSTAHRGVIVISDRKLAGNDRLRRLYRRVFLGSLDAGLCAADPTGADPWAANVADATVAWERIWRFLARTGDITADRADALCEPDALDLQAFLPETRAIRALALNAADVADYSAAGTLGDEVLARAEAVAGHLSMGGPVRLKPHQRDVIARTTAGDDTLAILPTGYGKSFCFQLPALVLPGVTVVISPLVALMTDQALALNRTVGGAVRALVGPMRESVSRAGKAEVAAQLAGTADHGIRLVYVSPERAAQRAFADALRAGAKSGALARIAVDEAHTLVAWGDDFRPAFRRLAGLIDELRGIATTAGRRLPVTALTATATQAVRDELTAQLFSGAGAGRFATVAANPLRPEIAVWRRQLGPATGGPIGVAGLVEAVVDATPGHLIIYCTTVREVNTTWAQLRDWAGPDGAAHVRRFHGRLPEAEKADVLNAFRGAPRAGDEGFAPMVVVATSAFGLGVDRDDIAAVLVASPPTDLAALHQALGRAGRGQAGLPPGDPRRTGAIGMALATVRGWRTVEFLTTRDLPTPVLEAAGRAVLGSGGLVDAQGVGDTLLGAEVAAGRVSARLAARFATRDGYRVAVLRAVAVLGSLSAVDDLGDLPETVRLLTGDVTPDPGPDASFVTAVLSAGGGITDVAALASRVRLDPADAWTRLLEAHAAGWLDVSQSPARRWLTALRVNTAALPTGYTDRMTRRAARAATELADLRAWWADTRRCAQEGLANHFGVGVPVDVCCDAGCRCSACWADPVKAADPAPAPGLFHAFYARRPKPVSASAEARQAADVDRLITRLLWDTYTGLGPTMLHSVLVGRDTVFNRTTGERRPLRRRLLYHSAFGRKPGLRATAVTESLARLEAAGVAVPTGTGLWRWERWVESDRRRAARAAATGGP